MWVQAFLLLIVVGTVGAATMMALIAALKRRPRTLKVALLGGGVVATGYALLVVGVAAAAPERTLGFGEEKYICELECHLAYSVQGISRQGRALGIRLKVRFDGETISTQRPDGAVLYPGWRQVTLRDANGKRYRPMSLGDLSRSLLPGEEYETELVFDVDQAATGLVLYIADADPTKWVLIGSDNAPFRNPVGFRLSAQ